MDDRIKTPTVLIRMRCPECLYDYRFLVQIDTPITDLPEIAKQIMACKCDNHIPKIKKSTSLDKSLMSINGIPFRVWKEQSILKNNPSVN